MVKSELAALVAITTALAGKLDDIEASVRRHIENLRDAMKVSPEKARLVVRSIFSEPFTFTPRGKRFEVTG